MMLQLHALDRIIRPGISLERAEVLRRCRSLCTFDPRLLMMISMTEFHLLSRDEAGALSFY